MSTRFYADGQLLYDTARPSPELSLLSPKGKVETNRSGSASFVVPPTNIHRDDLVKMKTVITIERDNEVLFRGRVIDTPSDLFGQKNVTCEGDMSFLIDSIQAPYTGSQTVSEFFSRVIAAHNSQVESWKQFTVGEVSITEASETKTFKIDGYQKTNDLLNSELLQEYGGIIRTRTENGTTYIDYTEDPFTSPNQTVNSQEIRFGINLVDYDEQYPINDLFTILVPIGRDNLTIASVNGGSIYLESAEAVAKFGKIYHVEQWSDVSDANELKERAQVYLNGHARAFPNDLKVRAIDMHHLTDSVEPIKMGDSVRAYVDPRGVDEIYYCLSINYDFVNPDNDEYWLGTFIPSDKQKGSTAETDHGGGGAGGGGYGGESLSESGASSASRARKQQEELKQNEQDIRINARSVDVLLTKTGVGDIGEGEPSLFTRVTANAEGIETQSKRSDGIETDLSSVRQTANEVSAEVTSARGGADTLSARFSIMAGEISSKVSQGDFESYVSQTATEISSKVSQGDFESYVSQTAREIQAKVGKSEVSFTEDSISVSGVGSLTVDSTMIVNKLWSQNVRFGTLAAGQTLLGATTVGSLFIGDASSSVSFYPYRRQLSLVGGRGEVYAPNPDGSSIDLDHAHSLSEGSDGTIVVGAAVSKGDSSATFSIASTNFYKTKIAEAEHRGFDSAASMMLLPSSGTGSAFQIRYPVTGNYESAGSQAYALSQSGSYVFVKPSTSSGYGDAVARLEIDSSELFTRATVTLQGDPESVYVEVGDDDVGGIDYYRAGSAFSYYTQGSTQYYYTSGTGRYYRESGTTTKTSVGTQYTFYSHQATDTPKGIWYSLSRYGSVITSFTRYAAGDKFTVQGSQVYVTPIGQQVGVTPAVYGGVVTPISGRKLRLAASNRYRAGTTDSTTYYTKKT